MSHIVEEMPPTKRPEDPFVRRMGDNIAAIERNYQREGTGRGSRFEGELLEDAQAEWVVRQTRLHDRVEYELENMPGTMLPGGVAGWWLRVKGQPAALVSFFATGPEAGRLMALLDRRPE